MHYGFVGTPQFAADLLTALIEAGLRPSFILSQPDRPAGRGLHSSPPPVKKIARAYQIPCFQPEKLDDKLIGKIADYAAEILLVIAFGRILPTSLLAIPPRGCINLHPSLLPRWRGAAPIARAIENGDSLSGISLIEMNEEPDAGDILIQSKCTIHDTDTTGSLADRLSSMALDALLAFFAAPEKFHARPQDETRVLHAPKITKQECRLNWRQDADLLARRVRAFNPSPGCFTFVHKERVKIWGATAMPAHSSAPAGTVLSASGFRVQCGQGILNILAVQFPGRKISSVQRLNKPLPSFLESPPP